MKYLVLIVLLFSLTLVSADMITPGEKTISIENKITNIHDFPEYIFVSTGRLGDVGKYNEMCGLELVGDDGVILGGGYKFCSFSVYAVKEQEFNEEILNSGNVNEINNYLDLYATEVVQNVRFSESASLSDTRELILNSYSIKLEEPSIEPNNIEIERNYLVYFYILVPIFALIIIAVVLIKRRKHASH